MALTLYTEHEGSVLPEYTEPRLRRRVSSWSPL